MITLQEIQEKYPDPIKVGNGPGYCVGGAVCLATRYWQENGYQEYRVFPRSYVIAAALKKLNPLLPDDLSTTLARNIIEANDKGDFKTAYGYVEQALKGE